MFLRFNSLLSQQAAGNLTRQISRPLSHIFCNLCNLRILWMKLYSSFRIDLQAAIGKGNQRPPAELGV